MGRQVSEVWRVALDGRSQRLVRLAQAEWSSWPDSLLGEWDCERLAVGERFPGLSLEECGWLAWARTRCGFTTARGLLLVEERKAVREGAGARADDARGKTAAA
jgi:hypothetical protein